MITVISTGKGARCLGVEYQVSESNAEVLVGGGFATYKTESIQVPVETKEVEEIIKKENNAPQRGRKPKNK